MTMSYRTGLEKLQDLADDCRGWWEVQQATPGRFELIVDGNSTFVGTYEDCVQTLGMWLPRHRAA
jgi:hypothetical protein